MSLIPLQILYVFADFLFFLIYRIIRYRREIVRNNLQSAFPDLKQEELNSIEKKFYQHFCDLIVESLKLLTIRPNNLFKRFKILNPELVDSFKGENQSFILYCGHLGNWEWLAILPLILKPKILTFYLTLSNKYFNNLIKIIRERFGIESVDAGKGYKTLLKYSAANVNTFTLFVADQSPHKDTSMHWTWFLNQDTAFNTGINTIAQKMNKVVLFPHFRKVARGYYEIEFMTIWDAKKPLANNELIEIFAANLENAVRESPHLWLWTHRRWKLRKV